MKTMAAGKFKDGRYLIFKSLKSPAEVWIQRVGSDERRALVQGQFGARQSRVSPDSRWLAYTLDLPSGPEVFAQPFGRPGERIQVPVKGGFGPVWHGQKFLVNTIVDDSDNAPLEVTLNWTAGLTK